MNIKEIFNNKRKFSDLIYEYVKSVIHKNNNILWIGEELCIVILLMIRATIK